MSNKRVIQLLLVLIALVMLSVAAYGLLWAMSWSSLASVECAGDAGLLASAPRCGQQAIAGILFYGGLVFAAVAAIAAWKYPSIKVTIAGLRMQTALPFLCATFTALFYALIFLTEWGNFFHGGGPIDHAIVSAVMVMSAYLCLEVVRSSQRTSVRVVAALAGLLPAFATVTSLWTAYGVVFGP